MKSENNQALADGIAAVCVRAGLGALLQWMIVDKSGERETYCYGHD